MDLRNEIADAIAMARSLSTPCSDDNLIAADAVLGWLKDRKMVVVPKEPTEAMEYAAGGDLCSAIEARAEDYIVCGAVYRAMIAAATRVT